MARHRPLAIGFVDRNRAASHQNLTTNQHGPDDPYPPKLGERGSTQAARPRPPNPRDTTAPPSPPPPPNTSPRGSSQKHGSIRLRRPIRTLIYRRTKTAALKFQQSTPAMHCLSCTAHHVLLTAHHAHALLIMHGHIFIYQRRPIEETKRPIRTMIYRRNQKAGNTYTYTKSCWVTVLEVSM